MSESELLNNFLTVRGVKRRIRRPSKFFIKPLYRKVAFFVFRERVSFLLSAFIKITAKMNDITSLIREAQSIVTIL